jgi:hypothetical protein
MKKNLGGPIDPWTPDGPAYLEDFLKKEVSAANSLDM